jgi:hypothetical protein
MTLEIWRREGKICIKRFRGFGTFKSDYSLQFQSGNTFVADVMLRGGKFYLEVSVLEIDSVVQFGFFTDGFFSREPAQGGFKGVGDDAASWAVDGTRQFKCFTGAKSDFGTKWVNGDVVLCTQPMLTLKTKPLAPASRHSIFVGWPCSRR